MCVYCYYVIITFYYKIRIIQEKKIVVSDCSGI